MVDGKVKKNADLPVRVASAVAMLLVAGTALWLGGWFWTLFVAVVGLGVLWEFTQLVPAIATANSGRAAWTAFGIAYIALGCLLLARLGGDQSASDHWSRYYLISILVAVIGTDIGAYFAGRTFGGPKIAPKISPSKTWSGLVGGMLGASLVLLGWNGLSAGGNLLSQSSFPVAGLFSDWREAIGWSVAYGSSGAVIAQTGDFFESWMKRRAGVKDSGNLIPGHGGLFDRVDGLLAVCFVLGLFMLPGLLTSQ